jgi:hypothetical protein
MASNTYFISADGQHDSFEQGAWSYYITNVLLFIYGLGVVCSLVLLQNATVLHTNTLGNSYGPLYSDRFVTPWWWALFFGATRVLMFMCVCSMLLYRKTGGWCVVIWMVPITLFILLDVASLFILGNYLGACNANRPGNWNNPCNSYVYCCDERIYSNPDNNCRPTGPCPPGQAQTLEQMQPNADFLWLFALSVVAIVFDIYFFTLPFITSLTRAKALRSAFDVAKDTWVKDWWLGYDKEK